MRTRIGVGRKIVILIIALLIITAGAVLFINRSMFAQSMRTQLTEYQLPLVSDVALSSVSTRILRVSDALKLAAANPYFIDWMRASEPEEEEEQIYRTVDSIITTYGTLGANFISDHTHKYFDILEGQRYLRHVDETVDTWFTGFRDSGQQVSIVIYVGDPTWGTKAFINERVELDGKWRGIMSASIDLQDMADELNRMKVGRHGAAFIVNEAGMVRFSPTTRLSANRWKPSTPPTAPSGRRFRATICTAFPTWTTATNAWSSPGASRS
ncbi:MAG: cache domain-containing protein [Planctomycetaceae bacterium]|nr:cache domain-containing protein [Planctomycetaceae bacterium]